VNKNKEEKEKNYKSICTLYYDYSNIIKNSLMSLIYKCQNCDI